ncbi:MAG: tetratricopeptide repeat protein [Saprospiraceae bacterium]
MYTKRFYFLQGIFLILFSANGLSQPEYPLYRKADKQFDLGQFQDAETAYRKAEEIKPKPETSYNLGNSVYAQNRMPEAVTQYQKAIESSKDPILKSNAYYNMGNAHFQNKEYDEAIKNYKESLKLMPTDEDAKKNLMLAMRQLQQQQQQQKDQQNKDNNKNNNKDQQNQDQQQQQQQQSDKDKKDQQQQESQNQSQQDQQKQQSKEDVSKEEAKEILKAVEREDQRVQDKLKKVRGSKAPPVKDW